MSNGFLCTSCRRIMCMDCKSVADEYAELYQNRNIALMTTNDKAEILQRENESLKRELARWKEMAQPGYPEVMRLWMEATIETK